MGKRKPGKRDKSGRLKRATTRAGRAPKHDYGNVRVQERRAMFRIFQGGKADNEVHDAPGQAWACGLFDGLPVDAIAIRDVAREYGDLYWYWYSALMTQVAQSERKSRVTGDNTPNMIEICGAMVPDAVRREKRFQKLDDAIGGTLASPVRHAIHELCVDSWGSDVVSPWLERLINVRRVMRGQSVAGRLADSADWARWELCVEGLLAMAAGSERRVA